MKQPTDHSEPTQKRIRALIGDTTVLDSTDALLVWEWPHYPTYYLPRDDVRADLVERARPGDPRFPDHVSFDWNIVDHWLEEDEEVFVHPRDPYSRIDFLPSSRRVQVMIDGVEVANSTDVVFLHETRLPRRAYLAPGDVHLDATASDLHTDCPYKGTASYLSATVNGTVYENIAWFYPDPIWQAAPIRDRICFFDEKVDILIDGVLQDRPRTHFATDVDS